MYLAVAAVLLAGATWGLAAPGPAVPWWTVDGGGGTSSGGSYALTGTVGQAEPGPRMQGEVYELAGGFWGAGEQAAYTAYMPAVMRAGP